MGNESTEIIKGSIYLLKHCPPLHGEEKKDRPVVVIGPIPNYGKVLIVAISSSVKASVRDRIALPDRTTDPQSTTGLDQPCWAVPAWYAAVTPKRLGGKKIGQLPEALRMEVTTAVLARLEARFPGVRIDEDGADRA